MTLHYPYTPNVVSHAIIPLGGRRDRPRPVISVSLTGPTDTRLSTALVDTGSDDSVFDEALAVKIGLDLSNAPTGSGQGVGSAVSSIRYAEVTLRITDGTERRQWKAWVGFTATPLPYNVLGFAGCLQFFTTAFHGDLEKFELEVNSLYPGT